MFFPISNTDISPIYLAVVGFLIGILGGFFGVGGSFIAGQAVVLDALTTVLFRFLRRRWR